MDETWKDSQRLEAGFWGTCANTYGEETKQLLYMDRMGFKASHDGKSPFSYDGGGLSYLDIGGGPVSVLLKFRNARRKMVIDPCLYPLWIYERYEEEGIEYLGAPGEVAVLPDVDVALIYNVLQHGEVRLLELEHLFRRTTCHQRSSSSRWAISSVCSPRRGGRRRIGR